MKSTFKGENGIPAVTRPQPNQNRKKNKPLELPPILGLNPGASNTNEKNFQGWKWHSSWNILFSFQSHRNQIKIVLFEFFPIFKLSLRPLRGLIGLWVGRTCSVGCHKWYKKQVSPYYYRLFCLSIQYLVLAREVLSLMIKWPPCIVSYKMWVWSSSSTVIRFLIKTFSVNRKTLTDKQRKHLRCPPFHIPKVLSVADSSQNTM